MSGFMLPNSSLYLVDDRLSLLDGCSSDCPFHSQLNADTDPESGPVPLLHVLHHTPGLVPPATNADELIDALDTIAVTLRGKTDDTGFLRDFLNGGGEEGSSSREEQTTRTQFRRERFWNEAWPRLIALALDLPVLFPDGVLRALQTNPATPRAEVRLSKRQIACLLMHQLLCTLPRSTAFSSNSSYRSGKSYADGFDANSLDLHIFYAGGQPQPDAVTAYLTALFVFLERAVDFKDTHPGNTVSFALHRAPQLPPSLPCTKLCAVDIEIRRITSRVVSPELVGVSSSGCNTACVISANKHPGFGRTASQEEMHVGASPASWALKLLLAPSGLGEDEVLVVRGAELVVEMSGYSRSAKLARVVAQSEELDWTGRTMLFMDALPLDGYDSSRMIPDLLPGNDRELHKAYTAFASESSPYEEIITGHWGCGAFGGNKQVKAAIQWCAASLAGVGRLRFICWEDKDSFPEAFREFMNVIRADERRGPEDVLRVLRGLGPEDVEKGGDGVFTEILRRLKLQ